MDSFIREYKAPASSGETGWLSFSCDPAAHARPVERSAGLVLSSRRSITNEEASDAIAKAQHVVDVIERATAVGLGAAPSPGHGSLWRRRSVLSHPQRVCPPGPHGGSALIPSASADGRLELSRRRSPVRIRLGVLTHKRAWGGSISRWSRSSGGFEGGTGHEAPGRSVSIPAASTTRDVERR